MSNLPSSKAESQRSSAGGFFKLFSLLALMLTLLLLSNSSISAKVAAPDGSFVSGAPSAPAPGGVTDNVAIWYTGESASSSSVATWSDLSGNGNDATQATAAQQPTVVSNVLNGQSVVRFDGVDDKIGTAAIPALDLRTSMIIVGKHSNVGGNIFTRLSYTTGGGGSSNYLTGIYADNGNLNGHARNGSGAWKGVTTPGNTNYNIWGLRWNGAGSVELFENGTLAGTQTGATGNPSGHITALFGDNYVLGGSPLDGDIAEAIIFAGEPNDAQLNIIFNYLSAKYDLALTANDFYAGDTAANGDYDFDVAGIGQQVIREASGDSAGLIISQANSSLANGEYVLAGHKTITNTWTTSDLPAGTTQRWSRVWYLDKTGTVDATLTFDFSDAGISGTPLGEYKLLYSATNAFSFSDTGLSATIIGDQVNFTIANVSLLDGYYTLAEVSSSPAGAGTGAGGVGTATGNSSLVLWLKADAGVASNGNGTTVTNWADQSGFGNDAGQFSTSFQPLFASSAINGQPALRFDGTDDHLSIADDDTLDFDTEQEFIFFAVINSTDANTGAILSKDVGANQKSWWSRLSSGKFQVLVADGNGHELNTASVATVTGAPHIIGMARDRSAGLLRTFVDGSQSSSATDTTDQSLANNNPVRIGRFNAGTHNLQGDVSEIVLYNAELNSAEQTLINNYLAAKYNIAIGNDKYAGDTSANGDYDLDVAGIGQEADGDNPEAHSAGFLLQESATSLHDGDYVLAGHNAVSNSWSTSDLPAGTTQRWSRVWYLDKTGSVDVRLTFDFSDAGIGGTPSGEYKLLYSGTNAFSFSDTGATATISDDDVHFTVPNESLLDGYYTLAEADTTGAPGGVTNYLTVWLKANAGTSTTVNGGAIASWADQSGNGNDATQATASNQPKYVSNLLNGYAGLHFYDGTHNNLKTGAIPALNTRPTIFLVGKHDNQGANIFIRSNYTSGAGWGSNVISGIFGENGSDHAHARTSTGSFKASMTSADTNFHLFNLEWNSSDEVILYRDGTSAGTTAGANAVPSGHVQTVIGSNSSNLANSLNGDITEVVIFAGTPTASEREQISSYLALKYGFTLPYNYLASSGATVYDVTGYGNHIAGIGQDDGSQWAQTSSQSASAGAVVRLLHNGSFAADQTFLVWGHNGGASTIATNAGVPTGVGQWLERRWKVQETNSVGSVTVRVPASSLAALTAGGDYVLIVADDANFTSNVQTVPMTTYGLDQQATFDFSGTQYFTFGRSAASPTITNVQPASAISQFATQIYIDGTAFQDGATVQLNTTALETVYVSPTRLNAWVPAGQADGIYNLTVTNPDGSTGNLASAFTVQSPAQGDLLSNNNKLLSTPLAPKAGDSTNLALVVNQQGGSSSLSNVAVDFYQGDPNAGGTLLGRGTIASLAPDSSATTTVVNFTAPAAGTYTFYAVIDPDGAVTEASESNNTVSRQMTILPAAVDSTKPTITKFTLDGGAQDTRDRTIRISLTGSDDEGVKRYRITELAYVPSARNWGVVQESEWRNYTGRDFDWTLTTEGGGRYIQAYLSDAAGNVSTVKKQIITYLPTAERLPTGGLRYYVYNLAVGDNLEATVTPIQGNPDFYMYNPSLQVVAYGIQRDMLVDRANYTAVDADYHTTLLIARNRTYFNASFMLTEGAGNQAVMSRALLNDIGAPIPTIPDTIEEAIPAPPIGDLSVEMDTMTTTATLDAITFNWATTSETDNVGFNVYRSTSADEIGEQINGALISSRASDGAAYSVVDSAAELYETYYYTLESIKADGQSSFYVPVRGALVATHSNVTIVAGSTDTNMNRSEDGSNVTYAPSADSASVGADNIAADLEGGFNVLISTVSTGMGTEDGDISMSASTGITWTTGVTLTMTANRAIVLNTGSSLNATGDGSITLNGNPSGTTAGNFIGLAVTSSTIQSSGTGNMALTGQGGADANMGIALNGAILSTNSGTLTVIGTSAGTTGNDGVNTTGSTEISSTSGDITITGNSNRLEGTEIRTTTITSADGNIKITGETASVGDAREGLDINGSAVVISTTGSGNIELIGKSPNTTSGQGNDGLIVTGSAQVTTSAGNISLTGEAGRLEGLEINNATVSSTSGGAITLDGTGTRTGVLLVAGSTVSTTSNITVTGIGGNAIWMASSGTTVSTTDGAIQFNGSANNGLGINLASAVVVESTGTGSVALTGSSSNGVGVQLTGNSIGQVKDGDLTVIGTSTGTNSQGFWVSNSTHGNLISTGAGNISITATASGTREDIFFGGTGTLGGASATGNITLNADTVALSSNLIVQSSGNLIIQPRTVSTTIGIGGGSGILDLSDAEISAFQDGFSSITIGDVLTGTGDVDIDTATFLDDVTIAGGTINDNAGTDITAPSVTLDGNVAPGQSPGQLVVSGDLNLTSGESLTLELNGTTPATEHDQVVVTGTVTLNDAVLTGTLGFTPTAGDELIIILNDGSDAVTGAFNGLAEGDAITIGGTAFTISYVGGDGNDVVLFISAAPVANDDSGSTDEDNVLNVAASGVLANDTDADGDTLTVSEADSSSANGATVTVNSDGSYSYDPTAVASLQALAAGESLIDTFSYTVSDGTLTDTAVVSITVSGLNDAPELSNVSLTASISENETGTLSGQISDVDTSDTFTLTVDWGDGSTEGYNYAAGTTTFTETHQYLDDDPTGTASDNITVNLALTDSNGGDDSDDYASITVNNVAPNLMNLSATAINENDSTTLTGQISDVGTQDTFTLTVEWGDGESDTFTYAAGTTTFTETHQYLDDNPTGTSSDDYTISLTLNDDDTGSDTDSTTVTVNNVAPNLMNLSATAINENDSTTLTGQITDVGTEDSFTLSVDWGDGISETISLPAGTTSFTETHQYLDDNPTGTSSDDYTISLTLNDDDTGSDTDSTTVTVNNVAPNLMNLSATAINENDSTTLTGQITDVGTEDSFMLTVEWGDGISDTIDYPAGTSAFTLTHQYLDDEVLARALLNDFSIVATINDDDTGSSQSSVVVNVANVAPSLQNVAVTSPIDENDSATLTGEIVDPGTQDSFTLVIDWSDGISETVSYSAGTTNFTETHQYLDDDPTGTPSDDVSITLDISDDDGGTNTTNTMLTINNVAPDVDAGPDEAINEGETVTFSGSFTDTGTLDTQQSIAWDFGDGETITGTLNPTQTYNLDGVYTVTLTVTDDDNGVGQDTMNVYVGEFGPIAADDNYSTDEDTLLTVPAPGVLDNDLDIDGDPLTAILQSGPSEGALMLNPDGSFIYTPTLNFNGEVTFTYVANDGNQDSNSATVTITVTSVNDAPIVDAGDDQTTDEGEEVQFEGSFTDPGLRLAGDTSIEWDFGDGTSVMDTLTPTHTYQDDGAFTVTLTVTDSAGASSSDALLVTVNNVAPMVEVSGEMTATAGVAIDFTGTFTDPGTLDTHSIVWDFGDGSTATDTLTPTHTYQEAGTYTVTLTVTDDDGAMGSDSLTVTITTATAVTLTSLRGYTNTVSGWWAILPLLSLFVVGIAWRSQKTRERREK